MLSALAALGVLAASANGQGTMRSVGEQDGSSRGELGERADEAVLVRDGGYALTYFGRTLAEETFTVTRQPDGGYRVEATLSRAPNDQPAAKSVYMLDADRQFVSATYEPLDGGVSATYVVEDGALVARADNGLEQRVALSPDDLVAGPHYVTDFWLLDPLELQKGGEARRTIHTFGFKDWTVSPCDVRIERASDASVGGVATRVIRCRIDNGSKVFRTRSFIPEDGFTLRLSIRAPIGSAEAKLQESDDP